eukprot:TRINITY_DN22286_c0_g1_i1.p1 TRINITY_DN22286_c0_g1~~TRINITY_DN22286_c0_g1_i1.p1  ORF type:complete len:258 (+),score=41.33 TRINITY_DN22286_c0_g1_i1:27-800(+)
MDVTVHIYGADRLTVAIDPATCRTVDALKARLCDEVGADPRLTEITLGPGGVALPGDCLLQDVASLEQVHLVPGEKVRVRQQLAEELAAVGVACDPACYGRYLSEVAIRTSVDGVFICQFPLVTRLTSLLIDAGASVEETLSPGEFTLLHLAARLGLSSLMKAVLTRIPPGDVKQRVMDHPGPIQATALSIAVGKNHISCMKALVQHGASLDVRDGFGHAPLDVALVHRRRECAIYLADHGAQIPDLQNFVKFVSGT